VDPACGIAEGARTGLANVVTGLLLLAAMFLTSLCEVVPIEAAAPVLVVDGGLMVKPFPRQLSWGERRARR
jgi:AGZA family xanthine/uracil permease-like MFS transporter